MVIRTHIPSVAGGISSAAMLSRTDLERQQISLRAIRNFLPRVQGGAVRRTGTIFMAEALSQSVAGALKRFAFARKEARILEFGHQQFRIFADRAVVTNAGIPVIVPTVYAAADAFKIRMQQLNDIIFAVHRSYYPQEFRRYSDTNWTVGDVAFKGGPSGPENSDPTMMVKSSGLSSAVTLDAVGFLFPAGMAGSTLVLVQDNASYVREWEADTEITEDDKRQYGGNVYANRKVDGVTATNTGTTPPTHLKGLRETGDERPNWEYLHSGRGYVRITEVVAGGTMAYGFVDGYLPEDVAETGTVTFMLPAFTSDNGFPSEVAWYKSRVVFMGVAGLSKFGWAGAIDDLRNFKEGTLDDDAFKFRLGTGETSPVTWLQPVRDVLTIGTENEEFMLRPVNRDDALTPLNSDVDPSTSMGSCDVKPVQVSDATLFIPYDGEGVAERVYDYSVDGFVADRLEWEAEDIFLAPVKKVVRQKYPIDIDWILLEDGSLVSMGYNRKQKYVAFAVHDLPGGFVEDIEEIPGSNRKSHEVWLLVRREINGITKRYIERFDDHFDFRPKVPVLRQSYLDCAKVFSSGPYDELTGLGHLEGEIVRVMADGNDLGEMTVTGGKVGLEYSVDFAIVGLAYTSHLRTPMPVFPSREGDSASILKRPTKGYIWAVASAGGKIGDIDRPDSMEPIFDAIAENFDEPTPFNTGVFEVTFPNGSTIDAPIDVVCDTAMPFHFTGLSPEIEIGS